MEKQKNIPALRFPEFGGEWITKPLIELSENGFSNGAFNDPKKVGKGYRIINVKDMYVGDFIDVGTLTLIDLDEKEFKKNKVEYGDIFFTRSSLVKEGIAYSNVNLSNADDLTYDGHLIKMRPNKKVSFPSFLAYSFLTPQIRRQLVTRGKTTTMTTIGQDDIATAEVSLPLFNEQKKIATFLSAIDEKLQALKKKKALLEQYKKGVMQKIFSQELRFKDENGNDFADWEVKRLGDICECLDNLRKPINDYERQGMKGSIPYWGANNIMDYVSDYLFDETIVLLAEDGGNFNDYKNKPIANLSHGKCWVNNHTHVLRGTKILLNEFLFYSIVHKNITGYVSGGTRAKLTKGEMLKIEIDLPSLPEQQKIASFLTTIDEKINQQQSQIETVSHYKKGLLQQMFC